MMMLLLKNILRDDYPKAWGILIEILSLILMLVVFWFTSQAFAPRSLDYGNYFDYLIIGELVLYLPLMLFQQNIRLGKKMGRRGTFDFLYVNHKSVWRYFSQFTLLYFFKDAVKLLLLVILCQLFFTLPLNVGTLVMLFGYIFYLCVLFSLLGMTIGLSLIFWGRGEGVWGQFISLASVLGGAYFPIKVFPLWLQKISLLLNPITGFLEFGRAIARGSFTEMSSIIVWSALIPIIYGMVYHVGLRHYRKCGPPSDITF